MASRTVGTLAGMIPPSVVLIVFGIIARESIPRLFIAGIIPGLLTPLCFAVMIYLRVLHNPKLAPPLPPASRSEKFRSLKNVWAALLLAVVVIGGIYAGIFTPTEAGRHGGGRSISHCAFQRASEFPSPSIRFYRNGKNNLCDLHYPGRGSDFYVLLGRQRNIRNCYRRHRQHGCSPTGAVADVSGSHARAGSLHRPDLSHVSYSADFHSALDEAWYGPHWIGVLVTKSLEIGLITPPVGLNAFVLKSVSPGL